MTLSSLLNQYPLLASCSSPKANTKIEELIGENSSQQSTSLLIRYLYLVVVQRGLASCQAEQRNQFTKSLLESDQKLLSWLEQHASIKQSMAEAIDRSLLALKINT